MKTDTIPTKAVAEFKTARRYRSYRRTVIGHVLQEKRQVKPDQSC